MLLVNLSLGTGYHSQRNNRLEPMRTCNTTSAIMALKASRIDFSWPQDQQPEDYLTGLLLREEAYQRMRVKYPWAIGRYAPYQVHGMLAWGINRLVGRPVDTFRTDGTLRGIIWRLFRRTALIAHGRFAGYDHMVAVVGFESTQHEGELRSAEDVDLRQVTQVVIDDPYGDYRTRYQDSRGNDVRLSLEEFNDVTHNQHADGAKWIHVFEEAAA